MRRRKPVTRLSNGLSYSRVRTLIAAGRAADAEALLPETERLELAYFGTNLGARSLRGEARFWLGDHEAAIRDQLQVVEALGDFRAPTLFVFRRRFAACIDEPLPVSAPTW